VATQQVPSDLGNATLLAYMKSNLIGERMMTINPLLEFGQSFFMEKSTQIIRQEE